MLCLRAKPVYNGYSHARRTIALLYLYRMYTFYLKTFNSSAQLLIETVELDTRVTMLDDLQETFTSLEVFYL